MDSNHRAPALRGALDALPLFAPAIPFAFVFGLLVVKSGIPVWLGWSSSPVIFGGAIQVTLFTLLSEGASVTAAVTAALIVGSRHLLYSLTLAPRFQNQPKWFRWVGAYMLVDQIFALTQIKSIEDPAEFRYYYLGAGITFWSLWMVFTGLGVIFGPMIPADFGIEFAAPVLFISLMIATSDRPDKLGVASLAMALAFFLASLPHQTGLLLSVFGSILLMLFIGRARES